jgi:hypothetical protein
VGSASVGVVRAYLKFGISPCGLTWPAAKKNDFHPKIPGSVWGGTKESSKLRAGKQLDGDAGRRWKE